MTIHHGLSYEDYAANPATRSSHITAYLKSPRLYKDLLEGNAPKRSKVMTLGTNAHMAFLEPARFAREAVVQPTTYGPDEKPWNMNASACKGWRVAQEASGKVVLSAADLELITTMQARMPREVRAIFDGSGQAEVTVRANLAGIACQCRVDWLKEAGGLWFDLKTCRDIDSVENSIYKYGYHLQNEFYSRIISAEMHRTMQSRLVFVETAPPYRWRIVELDLDYRELARRDVDAALSGIAARRKSGCWDDPDDVYVLASPPSWAEMDAEMTEDEE